MPATGGDRTRLTVTIDWPTLTALTRHAGDPSGPSAGARPGGPAVSTGELSWGGPLHEAALRRLACDTELVRVVLGPAGEVLDLGRTSRLPSSAQRRALAARDRGCVFPGCDRPPGWCQAHHRRHWIDGGATDLSNLMLLCAFHHHLLHEDHWHCDPDGDGGWTATAPDGRRFHRRRRRTAA